MTPTDIEILNNHFWKPWQWMKGSPNFVGGPNGNPFIVKNHLEIKNAVRVLVEANLMENSWGGFSQTGNGILLTPKNQHTTAAPTFVRCVRSPTSPSAMYASRMPEADSCWRPPSPGTARVERQR